MIDPTTGLPYPEYIGLDGRPLNTAGQIAAQNARAPDSSSVGYNAAAILPSIQDPVQRDSFMKYLTDNGISLGSVGGQAPITGPITQATTNLNNTIAQAKKAGIDYGYLSPLVNQVQGLDKYSGLITNIYGGLGNVLKGAYGQFDKSNQGILDEYNKVQGGVNKYYGEGGIFTKQANDYITSLTNNIKNQAAINAARNMGLKTRYGLSGNAINFLESQQQADENKKFLDLANQANTMNQQIFDKGYQMITPLVQNKANLQNQNATLLYNMIQNLANSYANNITQGSPTLRSAIQGGGTAATTPRYNSGGSTASSSNNNTNKTATDAAKLGILAGLKPFVNT